MNTLQDNLHKPAIFASHAAGMTHEFRNWLSSNWQIWDEFVLLADSMRKRGHANYSARGIFHVLRWHRAMKDSTTPLFKINNKWSAMMARTYNEMIGVDFFREREQA